MDYVTRNTDRFVDSRRELLYRAAVISFVALMLLGFGSGIFSRGVKGMPESATRSQPAAADHTHETLPQAKSRSLPPRS